MKTVIQNTDLLTLDQALRIILELTQRRLQTTLGQALRCAKSGAGHGRHPMSRGIADHAAEIFFDIPAQMARDIGYGSRHHHIAIDAQMTAQTLHPPGQQSPQAVA